MNSASLEERAALKDRLGAPQVDHGAYKIVKSLLGFRELPVQPGHVVVLAIGVIVPLLAMAEIIAGQEHGLPLRQQQGGDEVALLLPAQRSDGVIVSRTLRTTVPAVVDTITALRWQQKRNFITT